MAEHQILRRTCDYCDTQQDFHKEKNVAPSEIPQLERWITLVRTFVVHDQIFPVQKSACKDSCAANIISLGMLDLPKELKDMLAEEELQKATIAQKVAQANAAAASGIHALTPAGEA